MKKHLFILGTMLLMSMGAVQAQTADYNVVPMPQSVVLTSAPAFVMGEATKVICPEGNADMHRNAHFLCDYINEMTQLKLEHQSMPAKAKVAQVAKGNILLTLDPKIQNDEGYTLSVTATGVVISGKTPAGVFLGIQTLRKSMPVL